MTTTSMWPAWTPPKWVLSWEQFSAALTEIGFRYQKSDHSWRNDTTGACASDEALRDFVATQPCLAPKMLKAFAGGAREFLVAVKETPNGVSVSLKVE